MELSDTGRAVYCKYNLTIGKKAYFSYYKYLIDDHTKDCLRDYIKDIENGFIDGELWVAKKLLEDLLL